MSALVEKRDLIRQRFLEGAQPDDVDINYILDSYIHRLDDAALLGLQEYNLAVTYQPGMVVVWQGQLYKAKIEVPADPNPGDPGATGNPPPDAQYWEQISLGIPLFRSGPTANDMAVELNNLGIGDGEVIALTNVRGAAQQFYTLYIHHDGSVNPVSGVSPYVITAADPGGQWLAVAGTYTLLSNSDTATVEDLTATNATVNTANITTANITTAGITTGTVDDLRGRISTQGTNRLEGAAYLSKSFRIGTGTGPFSYADGDLLVELPEDAWIIDMFINVTTAFVKGTGATYNRIFFGIDPNGLNNQGMFDFGHGTGYDLTTIGRIHVGDGSHGTTLGIRTSANNPVPKAVFANGNNQYGLFVKTNNGVAADFDDGRAEVIVWYAMPHA